MYNTLYINKQNITIQIKTWSKVSQDDGGGTWLPAQYNSDQYFSMLFLNCFLQSDVLKI